MHRRALACRSLTLAVGLSGCSALPPPFGVDPPAIGPVVEIGHGGSGPSAWTLRAWRSSRGTCVQIGNGTGCGDAVDSGGVPMSIGVGGANDLRWVSGQVAANVALVRVVLASGAHLDLQPMRAPEGSGLGPAFVGGALPPGSGLRPSSRSIRVVPFCSRIGNGPPATPPPATAP